MGRPLTIVVAGFVLLIFTAQSSAQKSKADKQLLGSWVVVRVTVEGKVAEGDGITGLIFKSTKVIIREKSDKGRFEGESHFRFVDGDKPKAFDVLFTKDGAPSVNKDGGKSSGIMSRAIYRIKGDTLTICWADGRRGADPERPAEFSTKAKDLRTLIVLKRAKADANATAGGGSKKSQPKGAASTAGPPRRRTWTNSNGKYTVEATFVSASGGIVTLRAKGGRVIRVPLKKLSQRDQDYVGKY